MRSYITNIFVRALVLFTCIPIHDYAHARVAKKLGDPTAENMGRLTLNPFAHFDPFGSIMLILTGFGWARPVPVNPVYFRDGRKGMAITALAGPVSNLILSWILLVIYKIIYFSTVISVNASSFSSVILTILSIMVTVNLHLAVFNILPVPPLDGSRIFSFVIPTKYYYKIMQYERYISIALIVLLFTGILSIPLSWLSSIIYRVLLFTTGFVDFIAKALI